MTNCFYCNQPLNVKSDTPKQVVGWVHGAKQNSMAMSRPTGLYMHDECLKKAMSGQASDQPALLDDVPDEPVTTSDSVPLPEFLDWLDS